MLPALETVSTMSKVEIIERRIENYQRELQKLKLQLKIAKLEQGGSTNQPQPERQEQKRG